MTGSTRPGRRRERPTTWALRSCSLSGRSLKFLGALGLALHERELCALRVRRLFGTSQLLSLLVADLAEQGEDFAALVGHGHISPWTAAVIVAGRRGDWTAARRESATAA